MSMKQEEQDYVSFALCHTEHDKFTEFFVKKNKAIYDNYVVLSTEQGMLDSFRANPLAVIIMNEPRCCFKIAVEYINLQRIRDRLNALGIDTSTKTTQHLLNQTAPTHPSAGLGGKSILEALEEEMNARYCDEQLQQAIDRSENIDELLDVIARDCIESNRVRTDYGAIPSDTFEFTAEQNEKYRTLAPPGEFWGGYAYLDDDKSGTGFIRLYSPQGSGKWSFWMEGEKLVVDFA